MYFGLGADECPLRMGLVVSMNFSKPTRVTARALAVFACIALSGGIEAEDNDCERPFTLNEAIAISRSFQGPVDLPQCKRDLGGRVIDTTEIAAAEIMGMLGIYTVACGRPAGAQSVTEMIANIVTDAVADDAKPSQTSLREVIAVRVYECVAKDR